MMDFYFYFQLLQSIKCKGTSLNWTPVSSDPSDSTVTHHNNDFFTKNRAKTTTETFDL